jgi:uncharacterized membrane protein
MEHPHDPSPSYRRARTVADLTRENVRGMRRLEELSIAHRSLSDRVAEGVARFCGSITFVWIHAALFAGWIGWNSLPGLPHFDPYPFIFLTLCVSLEAIFLASFILISQNYEMRVTERRSQLDLQINLLAPRTPRRWACCTAGRSLMRCRYGPRWARSRAFGPLKLRVQRHSVKT